MATTIFGFPQKNVELIGGPGGTKYTVDMIDYDWKATEANLASAMWGVGAGIIKYPDATSFNVTAGSGRSVNIAAGRAILVHSVTGPAGIISDSTIALTNITASTTQNLFLKQETSAKDGRPSFQFADSSTTAIDGMLYLAQITTSGSAVTNVVMNPDRFSQRHFNNRGAWDNTRTFYAEDVVTNGGTKWIALRTNTNVTPVEGLDWTALGGSPTGGAGGVLSGSYPNPGFAVDMATQAELDAAIETTGGPRTITQNAHGFAVGDHVYLTGSNTYAKARSDAFATTNSVGRVIATTTNTFVLMRSGYLTGLSGLTAGTMYYLSPITVGAMTSTMPFVLGQYVRPVFYADTATSGYVLDRSATPALIGTDQIATGGQISKEQLEYIAASDITVSPSAGAWTDVIGNQTFSIERADNRQVNVFPSGCILISTATSGGGRWGARLLFDNTTPLMVGGGWINLNEYENILQGTGVPRITGLGAGSHTVKLQIKCEVAATVYCRAASAPDYENFKLRVVEGKR